MRRRLAMVTLAVASLVVLAFLIPLAALVRNQAENRALTRAERQAQSIAAALAVAGSTETGSSVPPELAATVVQAFGSPDGVTVIFPAPLPTGLVMVGSPVELGPSIERAREGVAFTARASGGAEVLVPVRLADTPSSGNSIVVRTFVSDEELKMGVSAAWFMLSGLGVFLIVVAVLAADRLGRSMVTSVTALSRTARALGDGDLSARVEPAGPPEVADVGEAFNFLAGRLGMLLSAARESVADLSHRLRTPLTALRLQAETLSDPTEAAQLRADIDRMERAVDRMIEEARSPEQYNGEVVGSDLASVVRHRATFWKVLADEQGRPSSVHTAGGELLVGLPPDELGALVDTLIANVFSYTPAGAGYSISAQPGREESAILVVEDEGPGFADADVVGRGMSGSGSTGLGLDIAMRSAERTGGDLRVANRAEGGARVEVTFREAQM